MDLFRASLVKLNVGIEWVGIKNRIRYESKKVQYNFYIKNCIELKPLNTFGLGALNAYHVTSIMD
jgi:hypothetical protein